MSGSPVILKYQGFHKELGFVRYAYDFLGVYSGRVPKDEEDGKDARNFKAQLGIVWKKRVIDENN